MTVTIHRVGPERFADIRELRLAALRDSPAAFSSTLERERAFPDDLWRSRLAPEANPHFVAEDSEEGLVGLVVGAVDPDDADLAWLLSMWVAPSRRGSGLVDELIAVIDSWARATGRSKLKLEVIADNEPARRAYLRHGFTPTGRVTRAAGERDEVEMERQAGEPSA